ncbi:MAG: hypothetical protein WCF03_06335 [Nitrososphaeraceae archaeon]
MNTNEQCLSGPLLWIGLSPGLIFAILFYNPLPFSSHSSFILMNFYLRKRVIERMNTVLASGSNSSDSLYTIPVSTEE